MIPLPVVTAWRKRADWPQDEQVEQDLIVSRALVELFNHSYIKNKVAFRGGTALHKLIFPKALRYSEDIDLNRLEESPDGPYLYILNIIVYLSILTNSYSKYIIYYMNCKDPRFDPNIVIPKFDDFLHQKGAVFEAVVLVPEP